LAENYFYNTKSNKVSNLNIIRKRSSKRDCRNIPFSAKKLNQTGQIQDSLPAAPFTTSADLRLIQKYIATSQKIKHRHVSL